MLRGIPMERGVDGRKQNNGIRMSDDQRIDWLRLIRSANVGPRGIMAQTPQADLRFWP
jgi:hypothetical protein